MWTSQGDASPLPEVSRIRVVTTLRWGQAAPEFYLPSTEGRPISLREFRAGFLKELHGVNLRASSP